ncbi:hypothetical protein BD410DRAFT_790705 [Rickenella mellea]|uniref:Uncharacterized protein n=1 Tax=Rickenella mellea TaxID=50990 RepID=A0A4Y7Q074_9AGAM|nr:hypothetical protein BD410DRAFT_790705 [Rickenella mellea]
MLCCWSSKAHVVDEWYSTYLDCAIHAHGLGSHPSYILSRNSPNGRPTSAYSTQPSERAIPGTRLRKGRRASDDEVNHTTAKRMSRDFRVGSSVPDTNPAKSTTRAVGIISASPLQQTITTTEADRENVVRIRQAKVLKKRPKSGGSDIRISQIVDEGHSSGAQREDH